MTLIFHSTLLVHTRELKIPAPQLYDYNFPKAWLHTNAKPPFTLLYAIANQYRFIMFIPIRNHEKKKL